MALKIELSDSDPLYQVGRVYHSLARSSLIRGPDSTQPQVEPQYGTWNTDVTRRHARSGEANPVGINISQQYRSKAVGDIERFHVPTAHSRSLLYCKRVQ